MVYDYMNDKTDECLSERPPYRKENLDFYGEQVVQELTQSYYRKKAWVVRCGSLEGLEMESKLIGKDPLGLVPVHYAVDVTVVVGSSPEVCYHMLERLEPVLNNAASLRLDISNAFGRLPSAIERGMTMFWSVLILFYKKGARVYAGEYPGVQAGQIRSRLQEVAEAAKVSGEGFCREDRWIERVSCARRWRRYVSNLESYAISSHGDRVLPIVSVIRYLRLPLTTDDRIARSRAAQVSQGRRNISE
ncbi:hypothetical protein BDW02DRAFT_575139 [Decorospora gaudefroyi]|uniref:Uncharacterized protein n=1 Tax=Decorospora gaudefroyi TaxID=184978 RepID=A0A6A5JWE5_9PLEO|nr:hypothetical protein BDW02DRAFT_575139 [Decorospora gaudefroyi]